MISFEAVSRRGAAAGQSQQPNIAVFICGVLNCLAQRAVKDRLHILDTGKEEGNDGGIIARCDLTAKTVRKITDLNLAALDQIILLCFVTRGRVGMEVDLDAAIGFLETKSANLVPSWQATVEALSNEVIVISYVLPPSPIGAALTLIAAARDQSDQEQR